MNSRHTTAWIKLSGLSLILLFSACKSTETVIEETRPGDIDYQELERPIPYPIDVPANYQYAVDRATRSAGGSPGELYWQNESRYQLQAEVIPGENRVNGSARIEYQNNSPGQLEQLVLELAQNLHKPGTMKKEQTEITGGIELVRVAVRGENIEEIMEDNPDYQGEQGYLIDATRMLIVLDEPLLSGDFVEIDMEWTFEVPRQGAGGRMGRSQDNLFFIAYWYPHMLAYDDINGWFIDPFVGNAEFYHGFADYELEVTAPDNWLVMATGELLNADEVLAEHVYQRYLEAGESDEIVPIVTEADLGAATRQGDEGLLTWKFSSEKVRDVAFSVTRESVWDGARAEVGDVTGDGNTDYTRIHSFYRLTAPVWREQAEFSRHSITFLSGYLDHPYPWPHMTSVEGAEIIGGGMEYPMMTIMGGYNNLGAQRLHEVTAHEFAHMWIPMIVSTNERRYTWMDEGFTSFNTHQAMVDRYPVTNMDLFQPYLGIAGTELEGPIMRWSDFHYPGPAYGVASYPKPASILTALQGILGEELFLEAYHTFISEWSYRHPYPWDFFSTVERVADIDLEWFWRSWYYETWVLDQAIGEVTETESGVTIEIVDNGDVPMPVYLLIVLEDGSEITEEIPADVWLRGRRTYSVTVEPGQAVAEIVIDPDFLFPDVDRANNTWGE